MGQLIANALIMVSVMLIGHKHQRQTKPPSSLCAVRLVTEILFETSRLLQLIAYNPVRSCMSIAKTSVEYIEV